MFCYFVFGHTSISDYSLPSRYDLYNIIIPESSIRMDGPNIGEFETEKPE